MTKRRRGRTGQTYTASPRLRSYDLPPASEVTILRADGSTETEPAQKPKRTPRPQRRRRPNGPLVCAICGYPIEGQAATSTEHRTRGKPIHPQGTCIEQDRTKKPVKDPGALPRARGGSGSPTKSPNTRAVPRNEWSKVTCPRCKAAPGELCTVRTRTGEMVTSAIPHQERPQVVRRAWVARQQKSKA